KSSIASGSMPSGRYKKYRPQQQQHHELRFQLRNQSLSDTRATSTYSFYDLTQKGINDTLHKSLKHDPRFEALLTD
ncbi:hypothetical protein Csa_020709, partial [Cucumis sativus]